MLAMGRAFSSNRIILGSTFQYSTTLCVLRPIWSRFIPKLFFGIILSSWSTPRFTKRHLTSTSGRATPIQISTCLTLLSSFQSGRYLGHCIIFQGQLDTRSNSGQVPSLSAEETYSPERIEGWEKIVSKLRVILCCSNIYKYKYKRFYSKIPELFVGTKKTRPRPAGVDSSRPPLVREHFLSLTIW